MNLFKMLGISLKCLISIFFLSINTLSAEPTSTETPSLETLDQELAYLAPKYEVNLDSRLSMYLNENGYGLRQSYVSLSGELEGEIRAVITLNLGHLFSSGDLTPNENFNLSQFVREAYIEIRNYNGRPYAFVIGKRPITFGQNLEQMPFFEKNPLYREMLLQDVFGFTVELTEGLLGALDRLELTVYETGRNDLKIKELGNYSFRGQKYLSKKTLLNIGYSSESSSNQETKRRFNIGVVGTSTDGKVLAWLEGIVFNDIQSTNDLKLGLTTGLTYIIDKRTKVIIESTMIQNLLYQLGIGAKINLTESLSLGIEGRLTMFPNRDNEYFYGINVTHLFDKAIYQSNQSDDLFEDDYEL